MATIALHPSELSCAFAMARVEEIVGWGSGPFQPPAGAGDWNAQGQERMLAAGRMVPGPSGAPTFTPEMTSAVMALIDPQFVLLAQAKAGEGMRRMTVHVRGDDLFALSHRVDGLFEMSRHADLAAAAAACAVFAGAALGSVDRPVRIETNRAALATARGLAQAGRIAEAAAALGAAPAGAAEAAVRALAAPVAAGVVSMLYCRNNVVVDAETQSVLTGAAGDTWVIVSPAGPEGPAIVERSSVAALAARVTVGVTARLVAPA